LKIEVGLIGSCTNSSYEDIARAAIAKQVTDKKLKLKSEFTITPGSEVVRYTIERDGFIDTFENWCNSICKCLWTCIGMWDREVLKRRTKHNRSLVQP
jgi:aconitate hydratase